MITINNPYESLIDNLLDRFQIDDPKEVTLALEALQSITDPSHSHPIDEAFKEIITVIQSLIDKPPVEVKNEDVENFKNLVLVKVSAKIQDLANKSLITIETISKNVTLTEDEENRILLDIDEDPSSFENVHYPHNENRSFILKAVARCGCMIAHLNDEDKNDKEIVIEAVKNTGTALLFVSEKFTNDKDVMLHALQSPGLGYMFVGKELLKDREIALMMVRICGMKLADLNEEFQRDRKIVLEAVTNDGRSLAFATELQGDEEIVLAAVKNTAEALQDVNDTLRNSRKIILVVGGIKGVLNRLGQINRDEQFSMLRDIEEMHPSFYKELVRVILYQRRILNFSVKDIHFYFK